MTDSTIDGKYLNFFDSWPETPSLQSVPGEFNDSKYHNVSTPEFRPGTKCKLYNPNTLAKGAPGWVTFIYLQVGTANATTAIAARSIVVPGHDDDIYRVTNNPNSSRIMATGGKLVAVALGPMTNLYYGWFQCGGPPAADLATSGGTYVLDSTFKTDGSVAKGNVMSRGTASGEFKLSKFVQSTGAYFNNEAACAWSGAADS